MIETDQIVITTDTEAAQKRYPDAVIIEAISDEEARDLTRHLTGRGVPAVLYEEP